MDNELKIYSDPACSHAIEIVDFGLVNAGEHGSVEVYIKNVTNNDIVKVEYTTDNKNIEVRGPSEIKAHESDNLILDWKPPLKLKSALKCELRAKGTTIIRP